MRIGLLRWTGTADSWTADPISAWNAAGTDPTLVASWAYINTPSDLALVVSTPTRYAVTNQAVGSTNCSNLAVFIWIDSPSAATSKVWNLGCVKLEIGTTNTVYSCPTALANQQHCESRRQRGPTIASASTTDLSNDGIFFDVSGTTTITALGTVGAGVQKVIRFTGALTLTHNSTSLILPGGANITTANGDVATFRSLGSGNWVCVSYTPATGKPVTPTYAVATQADQETGSSTTTIVTPGRQQYHPSAAKAWGVADVSGNLIASYNCTSVTDGGTGVATFNYTTAFSGVTYAPVLGAYAGSNLYCGTGGPYSTTQLGIYTADAAGALADPIKFFFAAFGDQ